MTIATILLHAPAGHVLPTVGPAAWAIGAAAALGARLTAAVFEMDVLTGGPTETGRSTPAKDEKSGGVAAETANRLIQAATGLGVEVVAVTGRSFAYGLPEILAEHARLHDLVVTGVDRSGFLSERAIAEHLVFEAGRPVVVVPPDYRGAVGLRRITVAWDNSRAAARALGDAMPLLRRASEVGLVSVGGERPIDQSLGAGSIVEALARRGVTARFEHIAPAGLRIGEALARHALDRGSDLLVMGGFGHSRLRQFVLGGATRSVLEAPRLPVLLSH